MNVEAADRSSDMTVLMHACAKGNVACALGVLRVIYAAEVIQSAQVSVLHAL